ncbi:hypothetical protein AVEN_96023-1 [Araneus ventricosus]|uniref:Uncharacterized protein n=1 Tax=Araneus ventricosus TaxID=182803 RepID=A0A4Y2B402_ARAVE|nr:hypothetical protein AVEN_96023-1 [Araneus ventricosus]
MDINYALSDLRPGKGAQETQLRARGTSRSRAINDHKSWPEYGSQKTLLDVRIIRVVEKPQSSTGFETALVTEVTVTAFLSCPKVRLSQKHNSLCPDEE